MSGGAYSTESTLSRSEVLAGRGYPAEVIAGAAGNGNAQHLKAEEPPAVDPQVASEVEELPTVRVEHQVAADPIPSRTCAFPGCNEALPAGRRRYCSPRHADEAERLRSRARPDRRRTPKSSTTPRQGRPSTPSPPEREPAPADVEHLRPGLLEVATALVAAGAEVELEVDGAKLVARGRR